MRRIFWIPVAAICLAVISCGPDKPAGTSAAGGPENHPALTPASSGGTASDTAEMTMPVPPAGAQYTLLCASFVNEGHIIQANNVKTNLINNTKLKGWYVVHSEKESDLYYGFYKTFDDKKQPDEVDRAQNDRAAIAAIQDEAGNPMFPQLMFVPITTPDPPAPKEWELASCKGYWTLQIAVYRNSPLRKQYAVDAVRKARAEGIEAYFHHSAETSEVCIGSWPKEAVSVQNPKPDDNADPNARPLYMSRSISNDPNHVYYDRDGKPMKVILPPSYVPVDPTLLRAIAKYPYTMMNGDLFGREVEARDHSKKFIPDPSFLVIVQDALHPPDDDGSTTASSDDNAGTPSDTDSGAFDTGQGQTNTNDPSMGNLKSLGQ